VASSSLTCRWTSPTSCSPAKHASSNWRREPGQQAGGGYPQRLHQVRHGHLRHAWRPGARCQRDRLPAQARAVQRAGHPHGGRQPRARPLARPSPTGTACSNSPPMSLGGGGRRKGFSTCSARAWLD
jgi:hypothetical protein